LNRIKKLSTELLEKYPNKFSVEFDANKKAIAEIATVSSKVLRNELAGYITSHLRKEAASQKEAMGAAGESEETAGDSSEEE
jgi:small subunit ribosomal protein S17e